jgi:hypothetical protein
MTPEERAESAHSAWRNAPHLGLAFHIASAIRSAQRDATRAAYERAAKEISCACLDKPECLHPHACCREDVAAILALIDKEPAE